jgi:hypothetical protein
MCWSSPASNPGLHACHLPHQAKKAGLVVGGQAKATVRHSTISGCGEQGCALVGQAVAVLEDSSIDNCEGDGAAALEVGASQLICPAWVCTWERVLQFL